MRERKKERMRRQMGSFLLLYITLTQSCELMRDGGGGVAPRSGSSAFRPEFEMISIYLEPMARVIANERCKRQLTTFLHSLKNSSLWAVQMFDSSAKIPSVLDSSEDTELGHFDECLDVNLKRATDNIQGKYCLVNVRFEPSGGAFGGATKGSCYRGSERGAVHRVGICVPNECEAEDVEAFVRMYYSEAIHSDELRVKVTAANGNCSSRKPPSRNYASKMFILSFFGLFFWVAFITILDLFQLDWKNAKVLWNHTAELFSSYRNFVQLVYVNEEENFLGLHTAKVMVIIALILCRRFQMVVQGPTKISPFTEKVRRHIPPSVTDIGPIFDSLIFICGFLTTAKLCEHSRVVTKTECFLLGLRRWLRLLPLYALTIAFYATTLEDVGDGPVWAETVHWGAKCCRDFWWVNLSFVNNYMASHVQCITQSWYLAVISQCSLITLLFVYLAVRKSYVGLSSFAVVASLIVVLFVWNDSVAGRKQHKATDPREPSADLYIRTHNRIPAYFVGAFSAFICNQISRSRAGITRMQRVAASVFFSVFGVAWIASKSISNNSLREYERPLLLANSLPWSLFMGWIVTASTAADFGNTKSVFLNSLCVPLSRLSYPTLLVHDVIQLYITGSNRTSEYVTLPRVVWMGLADVFASYFFALILHLLIEAPTKIALKLIFRNQDAGSSDCTEETNALKT